jgi:hypothetical protein
VFQAGWNKDKVLDFENGIDKIDLKAFGFSGFDDVEAHARESASGDVTLHFGHGDVLTIKHFALADMDATDFLL